MPAPDSADVCHPPFVGTLVTPVSNCAAEGDFCLEDTAWLRDLSVRVAHAEARLQATADPDAKLEAARFHPSTTFTVYWALRLDHTGHVAQLLGQSPGVILMAAFVEPLPTLPTGLSKVALWGPAWSAIVEGRSAPSITRSLAQTCELGEGSARRLSWLMHQVPTTSDPKDVLCAARCLDVPRRDLPADFTSRTRWLSVLEEVAERIPEDELDQRWAGDALRYASRHYEEFFVQDWARVSVWLNWLRASDLTVSPRVPVVEAWEHADEWLDEITRHENDPRMLVELRRGGMTRFPDPPFAAFSSKDFGVVPLLTPESLFAHRAEMRSSVEDCVAGLLRGYLAVYEAVSMTERSTLLLERLDEGGWKLRDHRGRRDREVSGAHAAAVRRWYEWVTGGAPAARKNRD